MQVLSQLAWMEETWLEKDEVVSGLASKGRDFSEADKEALKAKQLELMGLVLPAYSEAARSGQIEISTTPFYHPILPLVCDSDIARVANPGTPLPRRAYRRPEDAREQLRRAREYHERVFGMQPAGLWPSEGSVSDQALAIAGEEGFRWFGTDEGVLGRTLNVGFFRDATGIPSNAERLYKPWRVQTPGGEITGLFRDHHLSDLIGFVYSRMDSRAAAADLHERLRYLGERVQSAQPLTICLFLDGENAWEYYPGNGREFLREFYRRIASDQDFRALTASRGHCGGGRRAGHAGNFSSVVDQCEFRCVDRDTPRMWRRGNCCGMRAKHTRERRKGPSMGARTRRRRRRWLKRMNLCWLRKAATGAGGLARNTARRMTRSSTRCFAST